MKMKTFKQHINIKETLAGDVKTPDVAYKTLLKTLLLGAHNIQDPKF